MSAFRQNLDKDQNLDKQINSKKILQKNSQKTSKQILKFRPKKSKKIQKNFQTISQNIPKFSKYPIPYIALKASVSQENQVLCHVLRQFSNVLL